MDINVKARDYCAEITFKGDTCSLTLETSNLQERVEWAYMLIDASYDVLTRMKPTNLDNTIDSVHDKLRECLEELYQIKKTIIET